MGKYFGERGKIIKWGSNKLMGISLARNIDNLENRRDLRSRYTSLYRTLLNWCAKDISG